MLQQSVTSLKSKKPGNHLIWSIMASNRSAVKIIKELFLRKWRAWMRATEITKKSCR